MGQWVTVTHALPALVHGCVCEISKFKRNSETSQFAGIKHGKIPCIHQILSTGVCSRLSTNWDGCRCS